jgi:hypothetical protein
MAPDNLLPPKLLSHFDDFVDYFTAKVGFLDGVVVFHLARSSLVEGYSATFLHTKLRT